VTIGFDLAGLVLWPTTSRGIGIPIPSGKSGYPELGRGAFRAERGGITP
jgi:hypothetical protein